MIVRSQNRELLVGCWETFYKLQNEEHLIGANEKFLTVNSKYTTRNFRYLGKYATKERCLQVLDMIQERITNLAWAKRQDLEDFISPIFEMPQE